MFDRQEIIKKYKRKNKGEIKRWCLLLAMASNDALRLHIIIAAYEMAGWQGGWHGECGTSADIRQ